MKSILFFLLCASLAVGQNKTPFFDGTEFDPGIPSPKSVLGYEIGDRFTSYHGMQQYIDRVVQSSDRVRRFVYGESYEHRPLQILVVSSPTNLANLEEIRTSNLLLTDPRNFKAPDAP